MDQQKNKGFLNGLILGGLVGAGLFFLLGTEKGKKIQKKLKEGGKKAAESMEDLVKELEEKGKELEEKAQEVKEQIQEKIEDTKENIKDQVSERIDSTLSHIEALQDKGRETTSQIHDTLKKRFFKNIPKP